MAVAGTVRMAKSDTYIQFPIGLLWRDNKRLDDVTHETKQEALQMAVSHALAHMVDTIEVGDRREREEVKIYCEDAQPNIAWSDDMPDDYVALILAAKRLNVQLGRLKKLKKMPKNRAGQGLVRIRSDLFWDYHKHIESPWREFAVLAAIYSAIGSKSYAAISYERIRCMAMGFSGIKEYEAADIADNRLTIRQTQITVDKLRQRGMFVRVCPQNRSVFYSNRLSEIQLQTQVADKVIQRKLRQGTAAKDKAVQAAIAKQFEQQIMQEAQVTEAALIDNLQATIAKRRSQQGIDVNGPEKRLVPRTPK